MDRSAPAEGYTNQEKDLYRRRIWNVFRQDARGKHVLLMPSIEGLEIDVAIDKGIPQKLLHVVDRNPSIVAHIKRRYPDVNTYGVDLVDACGRIARKGIKLAAANFDLTGPASEQLVTDIAALSETNCFAPDFQFGITLLRGREQPWVSCVMEMLPLNAVGIFRPERIMPIDERQLITSDLQRLALVGFAAAPLFTRCLSAGVYLSANRVHTMLWGIFRRYRSRMVTTTNGRDIQRLMMTTRHHVFQTMKDIRTYERDYKRYLGRGSGILQDLRDDFLLRDAAKH